MTGATRDVNDSAAAEAPLSENDPALEEVDGGWRLPPRVIIGGHQSRGEEVISLSCDESSMSERAR